MAFLVLNIITTTLVISSKGLSNIIEVRAERPMARINIIFFIPYHINDFNISCLQRSLYRLFYFENKLKTVLPLVPDARPRAEASRSFICTN